MTNPLGPPLTRRVYLAPSSQPYWGYEDAEGTEGTYAEPMLWAPLVSGEAVTIGR